VFAININAQSPENSGEEEMTVEKLAEKIVNQLSEEILLTNDQALSLEDIFTDFYAEMNKLYKGRFRPDKASLKGLAKERDAKVEDLLSKESYLIYVTFMEENFQSTQGDTPYDDADSDEESSQD